MNTSLRPLDNQKQCVALNLATPVEQDKLLSRDNVNTSQFASSIMDEWSIRVGIKWYLKWVKYMLHSNSQQVRYCTEWASEIVDGTACFTIM